MDKSILDNQNRDAGALLTDHVLEMVTGGSDDQLDSITCPVCGTKLWYSSRGQYAYQCQCGWYKGCSR